MRQRLIKKMVLVLAMVVMLVAAGCDLTLDQEGTGSLAVSLGSSTRNLVWEPALDMDVASYTIRGAGPTADDSFEVSGHTGGLFTRDGLSVGQWTITVDGYDTNGTKIATVQAAATVTRNATTPVTMVLRPLEGTGTLSVSMSWTDSQGVLASLSAVVVIRDEEGSDIDSLSTPVSLTIAGQTASGNVTNLPTGWYEVTVSLKDGNSTAWQGVFALRVVKDQTTTGTVVITENQILVGPSMGNVAITIQEDMDDPLSVGFSGMPGSVEAGDTVTLTSTGSYSGNEQYRWYINGVRQTDQTASSFSHTFDTAGTYTVSLLVLDGGALGGYGQSILAEGSDNSFTEEDYARGYSLAGPFALTTSVYAPESDLDQIINDLLGDGYRVADWNDLVAYYEAGGDFTTLLDELGVSWGDFGFVKRNGSREYSSTRYYYASRHNHVLPDTYTYLEHDSIDNHLVSLGSWHSNMGILAIKTEEQTSEYTVGDIGPSGGYVFYENPNHATDGWRYLEAAPAGWSGGSEDPSKVWGGYGTTVGGSGTAIGTGAGNTEKIVAEFGNAEPYGNATDYAAKVCADYRGGGYDDWFLPSKDELNEMYQKLQRNNLGGFYEGSYWSSSEYSAIYAWYQGFSGGTQGSIFRSYVYRVRPVRAF